MSLAEATLRRAGLAIRFAPMAAAQLVTTRWSRPFSRVFYMVESRRWAVHWVGHYVSNSVRMHYGIDCRTTRVDGGIARQLVHYGSRHLFFRRERFRRIRNNLVVFTWFHGDASDPNEDNQRMIAQLPEASERAAAVVTPATLVAERLVRWGVDRSKLHVIPLGVDLGLFRPPKGEPRAHLRRRLGIPEDALCVGSFQKDGEGWGEGSQPKLVKGPDVFLEVLSRLASRPKLHVLLTGPARGYVRSGLEKLRIPYTHVNVRDYRDLPAYYGCLDVYLVCSRDEGGPNAIVESMATAVPVVSTRVGMARDVIDDGVNGMLANREDTAALANAVAMLLDDRARRASLAEAGLETITAYDWSEIGARYGREVYRPLLELGAEGR